MKGPVGLICAGLAALALQGALAAVTPAAAQSLTSLRELDTDGDGAISVDEARRALKLEFSRLDANHDGVVSEDEFVQARLAELSRLDTNGDGNITRDEIRGQLRARMSR